MTEETINIDLTKQIDTDLLLRQSRLLYPEVPDFILNLAIEAYVNENTRNDETINDKVSLLLSSE